MTTHLLPAVLLTLTISPLVAYAVDAADTKRQAEVAKRGEDVMPFSLRATTHICIKTAEGGTQRVVAKSAAGTTQVRLVRAHPHDIQAEFLKGDSQDPRIFAATRCPDSLTSRQQSRARSPLTTRMWKAGRN